MNAQEFVLSLGTALVLIFGVVVWLGASTATVAVPAFFGDLIFWPLDGLQTSTANEARLLSAIGGGIVMSWGWMLWTLVGDGMRLAPAFAKRTVLTSVWAWLVVDRFGSVLAAAPLNLVGNLVFLALFTLPFTKLFVTHGALSAEPL